MINLNLGSGIEWEKEDWIAIDKLYVGQKGLKFDLLKTSLLTEFKENSVDLIFTSHTLEHFTFNENCKVLKDCYLLLKPGGGLRVVVPDLELICKKYLNKDPDWWKNNQIGPRPKSNFELSILFLNAIGGNRDYEHFLDRDNIAIIRGAHYSGLDTHILKELLIRAGFTNIYQCEYEETRFEEFKDLDGRPRCSLYMEAIK